MSGSPFSTPQQEQDWMTGLRAGRASAFRAIFDAYAPALWRFARRMVPADVADDIVQDVLADLWHRRGQLEIHTGLGPYLFRAVRHRTINHTRRARWLDETHQGMDLDAPPAMAQPSPSPDDHILAGDLRAALMRAMQQLSELQRAALRLRWVHEMSYEQIAQVLSISVDAARQQVSRTQRVIRPLLTQFLGDST